MRGAVVFSGQLRAYRKYIDNLMKNFVELNDLDVFCSFQKHSSYMKRLIVSHDSEVVDEHDEEEFLKSVFGDRLKLLHWGPEKIHPTEEAPSDNQYLRNLIKFQNYKYEHFKRKYATEQLVNQWFSVDQFGRVAIAAEQFKHWCDTNNMKYDYVVRFRIDVDVIEPISITNLLNSHPFESKDDVYIRRWYASSIKELFVTTPESFYNICTNFPNSMFSYSPKNFHPNFTAPEFQLGQFLREHEYKTYEWRVEYRYVDDEPGNERNIVCAPQPGYICRTPIFITDFLSDMTIDDIDEGFKRDPSLHLEFARPERPIQHVTPTPPIVLQDAEYTDLFLILFVVFLVLFVASNGCWWILYRRNNIYTRSTNKFT